MSAPQSPTRQQFQTVCPARRPSPANSAVDEDTKRTFDCLHALSEQEWRDWDHKTRHEWRLGFALWAALLAASVALLVTDYRPAGIAISLIGALVIVLHAGFLARIQTRSRDYRRAYLAIRSRMPENVRPPAVTSSESGWYASLSLWTQVVITALLILVFALIAFATSPNEDEYGPSETNTHFRRG